MTALIALIHHPVTPWFALGVVVLIISEWLNRKAIRREVDARCLLLSQIRPLGPQHYRHTGFDPALREATERRRQEACVLRRLAARFDSGKH